VSTTRGLRLGLCCLFVAEPVRFRTTTVQALSRLSRGEQLAKLSAIGLANAENLLLAVQTVQRLGIGAFRITSPLFPRMTHPTAGYTLEELPDGAHVRRLLEQVRKLAAAGGTRLSFHPDQFVVLSSPRPEVVDSSLRELQYHGLLAELVGAETINLHAGGVYGDKQAALDRFRRAFVRLSPQVQRRLSVENDDRSYTVADLLPLSADLRIPLVYDVHHHRCLPDGLSEEQATAHARATWEELGREPYFHVSSPKAGWGGGDPRPHADYLDPRDFPAGWRGQELTVDVEAKAKELAVLRLQAALRR